jgi:hypothetical protein
VKEVPLHVQHRLKPMHDLSKPERDTTDSRTEKGTELGAFLFHWLGINQIISSYFIGLMMGSDSLDRVGVEPNCRSICSKNMSRVISVR